MTTTIREFVASYSPGSSAIAFAWNGKHAAEFADANDDFRTEVVEYCLGNPEEASVPLLADLLIADAKWSVEAWSVPNRFPALAALFLTKAGSAGLPIFQKSAYASFDTYGACHQISLPTNVVQPLLKAAKEGLIAASDSTERKQLEGIVELFSGIAAGTAAQGWVQVGGGPEAKPMARSGSIWSWLRSLFR